MSELPSRSGPFDFNLARVLGLRTVHSYDLVTGGDVVKMPALDWKLYDRALNPRSKVSVEYRKTRGVWTLSIGGLYADSLCGDERAAYWRLDRIASELPHFPHFAVWRDSFKPKSSTI